MNILDYNFRPNLQLLDECKMQVALGLFRKTCHDVIVKYGDSYGDAFPNIAGYYLTLYSPFYAGSFYNDTLIFIPDGADLFDDWLRAELKLDNVNISWYDKGIFQWPKIDHWKSFIICATNNEFKILRRPHRLI